MDFCIKNKTEDIMKKFTAALAAILTLVMLVSAISATAKNNFGEVLAVGIFSVIRSHILEMVCA